MKLKALKWGGGGLCACMGAVDYEISQIPDSNPPSLTMFADVTPQRLSHILDTFFTSCVFFTG